MSSWPGSPSPGRRLAYSVGFTITDDIAARHPARSPTAPGPPPTTPTARSGPARGSPSSPACWTWPAWPSGDAGHRPQGTPPSRRPAAVHRPRRAPLHLLRHQHQAAGSSPTWNCATAAAPAARTASAPPKTPACATCPCTASPRTRSGARSSPWPANCSPGCRCSPCTAPPAAGNPNGCGCACSPSPGASSAAAGASGSASPPRWPWATADHRRHHPAAGPAHPADQHATRPYDQERTTRGPVEPRPPGATAGPPR